MRFERTPVQGAWLVHPDVREDDRGHFLRTFAAEELVARGLEPAVVHGNMAGTREAGTFRGLHRQTGDAAETKLIRCVRGAVHDVVVDVDPVSPTYLRSFGVELSATNRLAMYVPRSCLHGYLTLTDHAEVHYLASAAYAPDTETGARHDDPALGIELPRPVVSVSDKDASWPDMNP